MKWCGGSIGVVRELYGKLCEGQCAVPHTVLLSYLQSSPHSLSAVLHTVPGIVIHTHFPHSQWEKECEEL